MDVRGNRLCPGSASVTAAGRSLDTKKRIDKRLWGALSQRLVNVYAAFVGSRHRACRLGATVCGDAHASM
jgi:hypothetical protein